MRNLFGVFVLCILFVFGLRPGFASVSAQAETPVEAPAVTDNPYVDVTTAGDQLMTTTVNFVVGIVSMVGGGGLVTVLTAITKRLSPFQSISAGTIAFAWGVVITVAVSVAAFLGFQAQFQRGFEIINTFLPGVIMLLGIPVTASYFHEQAAKVPGGGGYIGYKRTDPRPVLEAIPAASLAAYQPHIVTTMSAELDEATILRIANQAAVAALDRVGFNWSPEKPADG